jgi:hypothetical protein
MIHNINSFRPALVLLFLSVIIVLISTSCSPSIEQELAPSPPGFNTTPSASLPTSTSTSQADQVNLSPPPVPPTATEATSKFTATPETGLHMVTGESGVTLGKIRHLWVDLDGNLWVGTDTGIFVQEEDGWESRYEGGIERLLGADTNGLVWVILEGETGIAVYDLSHTWRVYGQEQGWTVPAEIEYLSPGYGDGLVTDPQGRVWLATGRDDVRYFDPDSLFWHVLNANDIGFDPPIEVGYQGHFLSDVELSRNQKVWVGDCIGIGEGLEGQGVRWTDGEDWFETPDTSGECVQDIEKDIEGKMWVGGFDALLMYDPDLGYWTWFPLPPWDRRQLITDITLDSSRNPWIEVLQYGGASPLGAVVRYHLLEGEWVKDHEGWFSSLAIGKDGVAWLCSEGRIFQLENGGSEEVGDVPGMDCQIVRDGRGRIWVTNFTDLWWFDPQLVNE